MTGKLYIVQARPETVRARQSQGSLKKTSVTEKGALIVEGTAIGSDAATGKVRVIENVADMATLQEGEILVADMTDRKYNVDVVNEHCKLKTCLT